MNLLLAGQSSGFQRPRLATKRTVCFSFYSFFRERNILKDRQNGFEMFLLASYNSHILNSKDRHNAPNTC